jgi:nitrogen fixation protein FixH
MTPRLTWLLAIIALLGGNLIAMVVLAVAANNGTNQVIPDYYARAVRYDDELDRSAANRALGWRGEVEIVDGRIDVVVRDAAGQPLAGARVRVTGYPRAHASETIDVVLWPAAGSHRGALPGRRTGRYDLVIAVDARGAHYTQHAVVEAR